MSFLFKISKNNLSDDILSHASNSSTNFPGKIIEIGTFPGHMSLLGILVNSNFIPKERERRLRSYTWICSNLL